MVSIYSELSSSSIQPPLLEPVVPTKGFTQGYLEIRLRQLSEEENWKTFMDVFALTIYGIMLFPKVEYFVDCVAINAFATFMIRFENPIMAVLSDVYITLDSCHSRRRRCLV